MTFVDVVIAAVTGFLLGVGWMVGVITADMVWVWVTGKRMVRTTRKTRDNLKSTKEQ